MEINYKLVEKYIPYVDNLEKKYNYPKNITHLLYLIIPAFITMYYKQREQFIISIFENTPIIISNEKNDTIQAYYTTIPKYINNNININSYIIINNYNSLSLTQLLDNLVHELNHAINSKNKQILIKDNILYLRTGLTNSLYEIPSMLPIKKEGDYLLEEILNTNQTEEIINLIKNYNNTDNIEINNTIYALKHEIKDTYKSNSYYLESLIFKSIINNKTFLYTLNNLRITGDTKEISQWFDNITNMKNSYNNLNLYLIKIFDLENKLVNAKFFKNKILRNIKKYINEINLIIDTFNNNSH